MALWMHRADDSAGREKDNVHSDIDETRADMAWPGPARDSFQSVAVPGSIRTAQHKIHVEKHTTCGSKGWIKLTHSYS